MMFIYSYLSIPRISREIPVSLEFAEGLKDKWPFLVDAFLCTDVFDSFSPIGP
jgi:hypothetical protein